SGPKPADHVFWGVDGHQGAAPLPCRGATFELPRAARLVRAAAAAGKPVVAAVDGAPSIVAVSAGAWRGFDPARVKVPPGQIGGRGGRASGKVNPPPGTYRVWLQGSFGEQIRVSMSSAGSSR